MSRISAKGTFIKFAGTRVEITKVTPKVTRGLADTTDSSNYDATSDLVQPSQIPVTGGMELALEAGSTLNRRQQPFSRGLIAARPRSLSFSI